LTGVASRPTFTPAIELSLPEETPVKIRAAVLNASPVAAPYARSRPLAIEEVELAPPGPGEVLVRVRAAGLCHSDLSVIDGNRPRPVPMVLGHEAAGEVVEPGPGVNDLKKGDRVIMVLSPPAAIARRAARVALPCASPATRPMAQASCSAAGAGSRPMAGR